MGKMLDMYRYYDRVRICCCYATSISSEQSLMMDQAFTFNRVLDGQYRITDADRAEFFAFYRKYREWLIERFMNRNYYFEGKYIDCFSRKERKNWDIKSFEAIYQAMSKEDLFFAQTFEDFASKELEYKSDELITAHKMYLGSIKMLRVLGYTCFDWYIDNEKGIIDSLISKSGK